MRVLHPSGIFRACRIVACSAFLLVVVWAICTAVQPAVAASTRAAPVQQAPETDRIDSFDRWRKSLSEERALLERQAERQYSGVEKLMERGLYVGGVLFAFALAGIVWLFGKSRSEFQTALKDMFEAQAKGIVEAEAELLRQQYQNLRSEVAELLAYRERSVVWVAGAQALETAGVQAGIERVQSILQAAGISRIDNLNPVEGTEFQLSQPDLVVLTFNGTDEARWILSKLVSQLGTRAPPVPLLVYTHAPGPDQVQLQEADMDILKEFDWYVPVNFPAQLVSQIHGLLRNARSLFAGGDQIG